MAYTNVWDETKPTDPSNASLIAADMRAIELNLRERINSIIGVAIGTAFTDPVVDGTHNIGSLRSDTNSLLPLLQTKTLARYIPPGSCAFYPQTYAPSANVSGGLLTMDGTAHGQCTAVWDMGIPVGDTITSVVMEGQFTTSSITLTLIKKIYNSSASSVTLNSFSGAGTGSLQAITLNAGSLPYTVEDLYGVSLVLIHTPTSGQSSLAYGIQVNYTSPDANHRR